MEGSALAALFHIDVVTADRGTPTTLTEDRFQLETGKMVGKLSHTFFNVFGQVEPVFGVQPLEFFFVQGLFSRFPVAPFTSLLTATNRFL